ncbi:actin patch protein 1 [Aspergillus steynii IBT 23096]|uniref:Actin patch protein 1 n=1 Tax=Aspergillus steynii IBT 23096 TaxID=1392250 RepID=A0A2I2FV55_9EURO|nr:actin patch protein 1 [Aspergillus steynii IBT 23096]PLB44491.1 actin patch protein 1 [Aspergillus steynii IBT 23096]
MSQYLPSSSSAPGGRRKKVFEYLKAANELRQSYAAQWTQQRNGLRDYDEDYFNTPGAFPDVEIARSGDEEMVIFPSYARRLIKGQHPSREQARRRRDSTSTIDEYRGGSEEIERPLADWEVIEDENAIVAVDVRGWVYAPHRGPMTRKHRLMIALARKLSGVPAPNNPSNEAEDPNAAGSMGTTRGGREDELVDTEAQSIIRKAEGRTDTGLEDGTLPGRPLQKTSTSTSLETIPMSKDELSVANAHLMERLRPFLTNPMTEMPVTVFFFNDGKSQSRSIMTDESGHFMLRAALPFVPTHVRVLASEELSAVKGVQIVEPTGVSLISDVDDTIKHSAIASGAKEIFRNTFVRELAELTIRGVPEWYNKLAQMGVEVHYVSNAPWQLYPLLERYFKLVGLPPGSVHLKQYSGMLQGIFEPTAERKRGPLEQILRDFPERKFVLVGDSGEADLEVYTDIALANPGRILGVFIRDITTPDRKRFFEKSVEHLDNASSRSRSTSHLHDDSDMIAKRPTLPPRRTQQSPSPPSEIKELDNADLIDLRDEVESSPSEDALKPLNARAPPAKPSKPSSLRTVSTTSELDNGSSSSLPQDAIKRKPVPPLPARRNPQAGQGLSETSSTSSLPTRPKPSSDNSSFVSQDPNDRRPSRTKQAPPPPPPRRSNTAASTSAASVSSTQTSSPRPPPQKPPQSYPAAAATAASAAIQYASDRLPWAPSPSNLLRTTTSNSNLRNSSDSQDSDSQSGLAYPSSAVGPLPNRREELWRRRWERAHDLLADHGVVLGSWREGKDVQDVSIWLVEEALKEAKRNAGGGGFKA